MITASRNKETEREASDCKQAVRAHSVGEHCFHLFLVPRAFPLRGALSMIREPLIGLRNEAHFIIDWGWTQLSGHEGSGGGLEIKIALRGTQGRDRLRAGPGYTMGQSKAH
jgi:hypothetical protein